jgi:hypothetical protein
MVQAATGMGFGLTSYFLRGEIPDVTGVAFIALTMKLGSTVGGIALALFAIKRIASNRPCDLMFKALLALAVLSICAAAFLRWYL